MFNFSNEILGLVQSFTVSGRLQYHSYSLKHYKLICKLVCDFNLNHGKFFLSFIFDQFFPKILQMRCLKRINTKSMCNKVFRT